MTSEATECPVCGRAVELVVSGYDMVVSFETAAVDYCIEERNGRHVHVHDPVGRWMIDD